ncbi:EthD family reductase [Natrarchaeobius halalkaliphilus]|uniref:EthD family reductase n=1 Tax=Natrarchaeobius halalkaliphilus TaxID=1679091 RepID=A0A3N6LP03_9EURY|nr:EthD family reductase [Natrarchaeobius halalkaliphilus]RQG87947.1 EthD family reductase [Natrarchaeobius halalkaliphilus]
MYKAVFMLSRAADLTQEEFVEYWETKHAPIATEIPNLERYAICPATDPEKSPHDGMAELAFESEDDLYAALDSDEFGRVQRDAGEFSDPDSVEFMIVDERAQTETDD